MLSINIDEKQVRELLKAKIAEFLKEADAEYVFWDASELKRRTCMSWNFIQEQFFFDPRFSKRKVGSKWYFPAKETREFLGKWLLEQPK
ncbi:hypothetical protein [Paenibacillus sp. 1-18]|uniref:hypothetical protein n=1 Tax=Paenibacillus sp. 1-18 TaxID=1333846 RepID=UPI000472EB07|nr:hypothetical protein [Paenibacillus sp. 1-18]